MMTYDILWYNVVTLTYLLLNIIFLFANILHAYLKARLTTIAFNQTEVSDTDNFQKPIPDQQDSTDRGRSHPHFPATHKPR